MDGRGRCRDPCFGIQLNWVGTGGECVLGCGAGEWEGGGGGGERFSGRWIHGGLYEETQGQMSGLLGLLNRCSVLCFLRWLVLVVGMVTLM